MGLAKDEDPANDQELHARAWCEEEFTSLMSA